MKFRFTILPSLLVADFVKAAEPAHDGSGGLLGPNSEGHKLDSGVPPTPAPRRSGNVIISRLTEKQLMEKGKINSEINAIPIQSEGLLEIMNKKVVFESKGKDDGEGDFQVVEVGEGNEEEFINSLDLDLYEYAEPDMIEYPLNISPNDPYLTYQYHHTNMQSYAAWDLETGSSSVTVAICDTGLQLDHPDLAANRLEGYQATTGLWESKGGNVSAVHPHGTQCAGCAAAIGNNGMGVSGVGWSFKHRPGRVSDDPGGGAYSSVLADCARKMCELPDVKVASVSYSGVEGTARRAAATYCKTQGALMVNAAGNDGRNLTQFGNADADDLIVVGASNSSDSKADFSAYGRFVDVWAPGVSVLTTTTGSWYSYVSGTSFSCPLTAGVIALMWSQNPALTPNEVELMLKTSTDNVGLQGPYNTPHGRINSFKAVQAATPSQISIDPTPWDIVFNNMTADFSANSDKELVMIYQVGRGRDFEHTLYAGGCKNLTNITGLASGVDYNVTNGTTTGQGGMDILQLDYSFNLAKIVGSNIWDSSSDNNEIELCQVVELIEQSDALGEMVIVSDKRNITIAFDLSASFELEVGLEEAALVSAYTSTSVEDYVTAYHCDKDFVEDYSPLAANDELFVCIKSSSADIEIEGIDSMTIKQGTANLPVIVNSSVEYSAITDETVVSTILHVVSTRVPTNIFSFADGGDIEIFGSVTMQLIGSVGSDRMLREDIVAADGTAVAISFDVKVALQPEATPEDFDTLNSDVTLASNAFVALGMLLVFAMW